MSSNGNGQPRRFENRFSDFDGIPVHEETRTVPLSFFRNMDEMCEMSRGLLIENQELREAVRSLDLDVRGKEIDVQAARFELAKAYSQKFKKLRVAHEKKIAELRQKASA